MTAPRPLRLLLAACAAWMLVYELRVVLRSRARGRTAVLALRARRRAHSPGGRLPCPCPDVRGPERLAWALIGSGVLAWALGEVYYTAVLWTDPDPPIPSPADAGYLLFPLLALAGIARAAAGARPRRPGPSLDRRRSPPRSASPPSARRSCSRPCSTASRARRSRSPPPSPTRCSTSCCSALAVGALAGTGWRLDRTWVLLAAGRLDLLARRLALPRPHGRGRLRVRRLVRRRLVGRPRR